MIKGNTIYFGYGDIAVVGTYNGYLTLQWFEPPTEVGSSLTGKEINWLSEEIKLKVTFKDLMNTNNINKESGKQIIIDGYTFDFSNYNSKSVEVVRNHMQNALGIFQYGLAC